jgi:hypothetical protein
MSRCEAVLSKDFLRTRPEGRDNRCRRGADFNIAGKNLCREHASLMLLDQAIAAGVVAPAQETAHSS